MIEYKFTIFTPLHNGSKTIHRVVESLDNSIYRNFEWIVVNDGSTDESINTLNKLVKDKDWDLTIIDWKDNRGGDVRCFLPRTSIHKKAHDTMEPCGRVPSSAAPPILRVRN